MTLRPTQQEDWDFDATTEAFSDRLRLYRSTEEPSTPLVQKHNGHIHIYQDNKEPLILTQNQFFKLAKSLGVV